MNQRLLPSAGSAPASADAVGFVASSPAPKVSEITVLTKDGGPLTKSISLAPDGSIKSDGSACVMGHGTAQRTPITDVNQLASLIGALGPNQAIALGMLRAGLPANVQITTRANLNGADREDMIARTQDYIVYQKGRPAFVLFDFDTKGMPPPIADEIKRLGGYWETLCSVMPELRGVARVARRSTSAGLFNSETGVRFPGSGGIHIFISVADGNDAERFLKALHARCWLARFGWMIVGAGGTTLERSIVDRSVGGPERLVFEGAPILVAPLGQNKEERKPVATDGETLDTAAACPPLTIAENAKLYQLIEKAKYKVSPEAAKARAAFIEKQANLMVARSGVSVVEARKIVERQCHGVLLPGVLLPFDDPDFDNCFVDDVLAEPARFKGATLADPLEGVEYGRCKAMVVLRPDGTPWINSFAHGGTTYDLKRNAASVRAAMERADDGTVVQTLVGLTAIADLDKAEIEELRNIAADRSGINKRTISAMLKAAVGARAAAHANQARERRKAERADPRPAISAPAIDAPWTPQIATLNSIVGATQATKPPARDIDGVATRAGRLPVPGTHAFTNSNQENGDQHD